MAKEKRTEAGWEAERDRSARTQSAKSRGGRDIAGEFPAVADPARKAAAAESFEFFCRTYQPETFALPWSNDHRRAIALIEQVTRGGGLFAYAMPRGSGKTSLAEAAVLWATLYGHRRFPVVIGSDESSALEVLESIKSELENNDLLLADFPEACYPIRCLEGIAHRANGQLFDGSRTHIHWTASELVLPTLPGSASSGAIVAVTGITGRVRGMKFKRPDGQSARPDLVLIDDPQTDESARSPSQCQQRIKIVKGAVLGLAGPGKKISGVMPCTVISPGDMADELLDRDKHPQWQGERTKLVYQWPYCTTEEARKAGAPDLWEAYKKVRSDSMRAGNGGREATEFYRANREAMDRGAEVAWAARHNPDELSALQHAQNLRADLGDAAFFAEYQNAPLKQEAEGQEALTADQIAAKADGRARGVVPAAATHVVAFVDVQKELLFYAVAAFEDDFTGHLVDYGTYPDQKREHFAKANVKRTLMAAEKAARFEESLAKGLDSLAGLILSRKWAREDGGDQQVERCLVDARWGESTDIVKGFCRRSAHAAVLAPSFGTFIGAGNLPLSERSRKRGDRAGLNWAMPCPKPGQPRHVIYDANFWKSFVQSRLAQSPGGRGCLSLYGKPEDHKLLGDHLTAEYPVQTEGRGRTVVEWKVRPHRPDNDWLDCVTGCCVAASITGASLEEQQKAVRARRAAVKLSDVQKQKRQN